MHWCYVLQMEFRKYDSLETLLIVSREKWAFKVSINTHYVYPQGYFCIGLMQNLMVRQITKTESMDHELWFAIGKSKGRGIDTLPKCIHVHHLYMREQGALDKPMELPRGSTSRCHGRSRGMRCTRNAKPSYMYADDEDLGFGDDYLTRGGVTLEDLLIGLQSLAHEFVEFCDRSEAQFEDWVNSSLQDSDYVPQSEH
ncbi:Uncharacterized protein TCM_017907 [Theobroma cacao]|uniref:Uncharacterized protein n=1 Tax=Theobroma cacao TaxID=3641 RepID=A0A061EE34_THECC|nr:Uncharacterized protein TCM_017907 [Theobroma cacao]